MAAGGYQCAEGIRSYSPESVLAQVRHTAVIITLLPLLLLDAALTRPYLLTVRLHVSPTCLPDVVTIAAFTCLPPLTACCQQRVRFPP